MNFSWEAISETIVNESFYWDGFFWQYFILACFALPLRVPDSNKYGLDEGRDRYNNYVIAYDRSSTVSEDKDVGTFAYICSCIWDILFFRLFIPYINIFVSYHLLFKKSWHMDN